MNAVWNSLKWVVISGTAGGDFHSSLCNRDSQALQSFSASLAISCGTSKTGGDSTLRFHIPCSDSTDGAAKGLAVNDSVSPLISFLLSLIRATCFVFQATIRLTSFRLPDHSATLSTIRYEVPGQ